LEITAAVIVQTICDERIGYAYLSHLRKFHVAGKTNPHQNFLIESVVIPLSTKALTAI